MPKALSWPLLSTLLALAGPFLLGRQRIVLDFLRKHVPAGELL